MARHLIPTAHLAAFATEKSNHELHNEHEGGAHPIPHYFVPFVTFVVKELTARSAKDAKKQDQAPHPLAHLAAFAVNKSNREGPKELEGGDHPA